MLKNSAEMREKMKKAAIIGLGDISGIHIGAIRQNPEIALAAVCDIDEGAKERRLNLGYVITIFGCSCIL